MSPKITNTSVRTEPCESGGNGTKPTPVVPDHELIRCIGEGGYGEVWLARSALGTYRAVKVVYRLSFKEEGVYEREFRGIQKFEPISRSNDGLLDILQAGRNDSAGYYYYVMELADDSNAECGLRLGEASGSERAQNAESTHGDRESIPRSAIRDPNLYTPKTLRSEIQLRHRLPPAECVQLALNLTLALGHLHRNGLIHRDIKPANIIFVHGIPKLADIGLVTNFDETCSFVGTEGFIAPEGPTSPRADLFSLGKVLYEISTGKDRKDFPEPATGLGEQTDQALDELNAVILKACATDPNERYQSAEEFHADLALLLSGKSVRWKRVVERRLDFARKILAVVGVIAVLATVGYFFQRRQTREVERNLYAANMNLAQRDWDKANPGRLSQLLSETEGYPDKGFEWYFWQRQLHLDLRTFRGHLDEVNAVAFSPDGERIVTGSLDQTARVWDVATGQQLILLKGHSGRVASVTYSPDGQRILTASHDGTAIVWDALNEQQLLVLTGHTGIIFGIAISSDGQRIVTASRDSNDRLNVAVAMWDALSGEKLRDFGDKAGGHGRSSVAFSPDGRRIAAITEQYAVRIWDASSGRELSVFRSKSEFYSIAFSPDGQRLVTGAGETVVWDAATGKPLLQLHGGNQLGVYAVAYSPDGERIVTVGGDQRVILWDASTGKELFRLAGHRASIASVAFSPDGARIATASADGTVKLWEASAMQNPRTFPIRTVLSADEARATNLSLHSLRHAVNMLAISSDGTRVAATVADKTVRILEVATGRELLVLGGHVDEVTCIAFSPDGQRIATGNGWHAPRGGLDRAKIWDCSTGRELLALGGNGFVAFAPDGHRIATSSGDRTATIWDASSGEELITLNGHSDWVGFTAFSPDGKRIATSSRDLTVKVWDAATGRELLTIKRVTRDNNYSALTFSPDGKRIAAVDWDRAARVWDAATGRELLVLKGHTSWLRCAVFSPDGKRILTASHDRTAKVWDAFTGRELLTLEGHTRMVATAAFSPDGRIIATAGYDGMVKIWEAASPEQVSAWRMEERMAKKHTPLP